MSKNGQALILPVREKQSKSGMPFKLISSAVSYDSCNAIISILLLYEAKFIFRKPKN
jgi:hypothetical protein